MQQISSKTHDPRRFDYDHPIKRMFHTQFEGGALLNCDYSSLEVKIAGLFAKDKDMTKAFFEGKDTHKNTASLVYGIPEDEVTVDQRKLSKKVTFGILYGETPYSISPKLGITPEEAEDIFNKYFRSKPKIKQMIDEVHEFVQKHGYVRTMQGFKRNLQTIYSKDKSKKNEALRQSVNTIIQGTGAFLTNRSLVYIKRFILQNGYKTKVVATVHDSILLDCPKEEIELMAEAIPYIMNNLPIPFLKIEWEGKIVNYPVGVEVEIGVNYNDMVAFDKEEFESFNSVQGYVTYNLTLEDLEDRKDSDLISEDQHDQAEKLVEANKEQYQLI